MGFGLFFPKRQMDMEQDGNYANQEKLNVDNLRRGETNANINTKIEKKKDTHTHSNKRATEIFVSFFLSKYIDKRNIIELKKKKKQKLKKKKLSRPRILCDVQGHSRQQT